jgi:hypothetical protein
MYNIHIFRDLQSEPILTVELHRRFLYYSFFFFSGENAKCYLF